MRFCSVLLVPLTCAPPVRPPCLQPPREASLALACLPRRVVVGAPFTATLRVQSHVDRRMGPLKIALAFEPQAPGSASSSPSKPASFGRRGPGGSSAGEAGSSSRESSVHAAGAAARGLPRSSSSASASAAGGAPTRPPAAAALGPPPPLAAVCLDGAQSVVVDELAPRQALAVRLQLLALGAGQQALPPLVLASERDGRVYATLPPLELFVDAA